MKRTVEVPDECIPHLVMLDVKFDPNRNELLRAVGSLRRYVPWSKNKKTKKTCQRDKKKRKN